MSKPDREITRWLAREYGVTKTWTEVGAKHHRICFDYNGVTRHITMGDGPTVKWQSLVNRKADLKRELGPPPGPPRKQPRSLEEMMTDLRKSTAASPLWENPLPGDDPPQPKPAKTWNLRIGAYRGTGGTTLLFSFPINITKKFSGGIKIERLDEENWKFSKGDGPRFTPYHGDRVKLNHYDPKAGIFGSSPGEAIESDDDVLVYCPLATRGEPAKPNPWSKPTPFKSPPVMPKPAPVAAPQPAPAPVVQAPPPAPPAPIATRTLSLEAGMREVIREIRDIEAACPYRLTRLDNGRIVWRAPVIE